MIPRRHAIVPALLAVALLGGVLPAEARNPHCAGGIQYVVGGLRDKEKGNLEDYQRQFVKAVQQLEQCASEDPEDAEALGYLGWAYAELDSCGPAGKAFAAAIDRLKTKNDPKKAAVATNNRDSYWANKFNDGIGKINNAQAAYPEFTKEPDNDADRTLKDEARKRYDEAIVSLTKASLLRPNHAQTIRNLGSVYVFLGDFKKATEVYTAGLAAVPGDSTLAASLKVARTNYAGQLLEQKKYDEAVAFYQELLRSDANNGDLWAGMADAIFQQAQKAAGDPQKTAFKSAGDAYAKAFEFNKQNCDLAFNSALAYQNARELASSEGMWRKAIECKPDDPDAMSSLAAVLAEQKKYADAQAVLLAGLDRHPQSKTLHRQLGGVYTNAGQNAKANEELMIFLAMQNGQPVPDPVTAAKSSGAAGAAGVKALTEKGNPDAVIPWEASGEKYDSWFYWSKKIALHFKGGLLIVMSDWGKGPGAAPKK